MRNAKGAGKVFRQRGRGLSRPRRLGHRRSHLRLSHFLECTQPKLAQRRVTGEQNHRHFPALGGIQSADRIGMPRSTGHQRDADFAAHARPGVGHVNRRALLANVNEFDFVFVIYGGIENRHDVISGQGEDRPDTRNFQGFEQRICSPHGCALHDDLSLASACIRKTTELELI